jgi:hypothetical protein
VRAILNLEEMIREQCKPLRGELGHAGDYS